MPCTRIQTNAKEPIGALVVDASRVRLTGLTNIKLFVRRVSDGKYLDWSDQGFKTTPTTILLALQEADATDSPGFYHINTSPHTGGLFDFSAPTNKNADDQYVFTVIQDGSPQSARNTPQIDEVKEGDWVDNIDEPISNKPDHLVLQNYSYDPSFDTLVGSIWVETKNLVLTNPASVSVVWVDAATDTVLFTFIDSSPDARGVFFVTKSTPGIAQKKAYYALATVTLADTSTIQGAKGSFTF